MVTLRLVAYGSPDYDRMVACRNAVLRAPMGRVLTPEELARDSCFQHIAAFSEEGEVIGTVLLERLSDSTMRARQVSVAQAAQGTGVGAKLMAMAEAQAKQQGCSEMRLHARKAAVPFYIRIGYVAEGDWFEESGLPHILMRKKI